MYQHYHAWQYCSPPDWLHSAIIPVTAGCLRAGPNYEVRPRILSDYYLVWITAGCGSLQSAGTLHTIQSGSLYLLFPNTVHAYRTDPEHLLEMFWISFTGASARDLVEATGLTPTSPLTSTAGNDALHGAMDTLSQVRDGNSLAGYLDTCGKLLSVFGALLNGRSAPQPRRSSARHSPTATMAHNYINTHYSERISVSTLSKHLGVSRVTLTNLFHTELGQSPAEYIQYVRMKHAVTLLNQTELPIYEIAHRVGYTDALYFSKAFSKYYGVPPSRFRELSVYANTQPF